MRYDAVAHADASSPYASRSSIHSTANGSSIASAPWSKRPNEQTHLRLLQSPIQALFNWLLKGSLTEPDARPASILIDEFDAGGFESTPNDIDGRTAWLARAGFKLMHGYNRYSSELRKIGLIPSQESARRSTLPRRDHV
jgi:hypothetical protein